MRWLLLMIIDNLNKKKHMLKVSNSPSKAHAENPEASMALLKDVLIVCH